MSTTETAVAEDPGLEGGSGLPKHLGRNVFVNYVAVIAISITAIVTTPVLLHHLGLAAFGIYGLAGSVVAYLQLFDMGFGAATIRQVAADAHRRPKGVTATLNTNFFALSILGFVALLVGFGVAALSPLLFNVHGALARDTVITFAILAVALAISIPLRHPRRGPGCLPALRLAVDLQRQRDCAGRRWRLRRGRPRLRPGRRSHRQRRRRAGAALRALVAGAQARARRTALTATGRASPAAGHHARVRLVHAAGHHRRDHQPGGPGRRRRHPRDQGCGRLCRGPRSWPRSAGGP